VTGPTRSPAFSGIPAIGEVLKGYEVTQWYGLFAPAGTARDIIARLHEETAKVLERPDVRKRLADIGADPASSTPEQLASQVKSEIARWGNIIKSTGIKPE
jgi:tripartite-type tricarboxylate transporter receptor subunit TctC